MYVGVQGVGTSKHELQFLTRHGVTHMDESGDDPGDLDALLRSREAASAEGVELEMIHIAIHDSIVRGQDPDRDGHLDEICRWIENAARAGLRGLNYGFSVVSQQRTQMRYGRGGSGYSSFEFSKFDNDTPHEATPVSREEMFEHILYFLERVIPVAEEYRIQMACHSPDPPAPNLLGEERWNYPVFEGLKRYSELVDSPFNGFNFCCGTTAEGLDDPGTQLPPIVEYFSSRKKIFNVHFRNIRGGLNDFVEVWPDEGDVDMLALAKIFHRTGYPYMLMPDHTPSHPDDKSPEGVSERVCQGWAFKFGYIIAMIHAVQD